MPVIRRVRLDLDYFVAVTTARAERVFHLSAFIDDIFQALRTQPDNAAATAAYLSYHLSSVFIRRNNDEQQAELAEDLTTLLDVHYQEPRVQAILAAAPRAQGLAVLLRFYNIHFALLMNGLGAPNGPQRLDPFDALRLLQRAVGAVWGPWQALIGLAGAIRDYHHARITTGGAGPMIELGRRAVHGPGVDLRLATLNLQGLNEASSSKYRSHILALAREHHMVAIQEAGDAPSSAQQVASLTVNDQFGMPHEVNQYLWQAGRSGRREVYHLYVLGVQRLRVRLAMVTSESLDVRDVVVIADGTPRIAGLAPPRPVLGLRVSMPGLTGLLSVFNFHAIANGGVNCPRVLREVAWHCESRYVLVGDFNRDPRTPTAAFPRRGDWILPRGIGELVLANGPTHPSFGPTQMLDYAITNGTAVPAQPGRVGPVMDSDHRSVSYTFNFSG